MPPILSTLGSYADLVASGLADKDLTPEERAEVVRLLRASCDASPLPQTKGQVIEEMDRIVGDASIVAYQRALDIVKNV
jgi:hypothetical protein